MNPTPLASATRRRLGWIMLVSGLFAASGPDCGASEARQPVDGAWTLTFDNDVFLNKDANYTNGIGVSWVSAEADRYDADSPVRKWLDAWSFLPFVMKEGYSTYAGWTVAQEMNTPDQIDDPHPPLDDQPYSGILYVDSLFYARRDRWAHVWELKLGTVGSSSMADRTQKRIHHLIGSPQPRGWDTQLPNEPVANVGYTVAYLAAEGQIGRSAEWRVAPVANAGLGTYFTGVGAGVYAEFGWNLVDALGTASLRAGLNSASTVGLGPVDRWSIATFVGMGGYAIAHYLPLDGTVFHDSRSVSREPVIGFHSFGMALRRGGFVLSLSTSYFGRAFKTERRDTQFGTVSLSWAH